MDRTLLTAGQLAVAAAELDPGWAVGADRLARTVTLPSFLAAVGFIDELAPIAERLDHHPDLRLSWRTVELSLSTHSAGGVTGYDIALARELDPLIARLTR
ncbi:MAG TPA: 4a-hydroxytetrahydrobiopterin dehydratase [Jatrophihabitans sp.]|nr:4a-hydroxytetrahydrobiopterin dehydratase [Jatrophihabitans sp.]